MPTPDETRIYIAGHAGMVGSALMRRLRREDRTVLTSDRSLDLRDQASVNSWMQSNRPDQVIIAAARVGGIMANKSRPARFIYDNLMIAANVIEAARVVGVGKLLFLGSSCIYPREAPQPLAEEALLTGPLEPTNEAYAVAKIAGIKLCQAYRREFGCDFISAMPTNLYGPNDNFDLATSHVLPALIRKAHEAKISGAPTMTIWGSGSPRREFLHVDDLADACVFLLDHYSDDRPVNVGTGYDISIIDLARLVAEVVGYDGEIITDPSMPDGTPQKLLDIERLRSLGRKASVNLKSGIEDTYAGFLKGEVRGV